jgi:mono/diheme cytochrome c family protein
MRALLIAAGVLAATAAHAQQSPFPDGPGKQIVEVACTQCHQAQPFAQLRMGEVGWRKQVYNMILRGAQISPSDLDTVVTYLTASYGPGVPVPGQPKPVVTLHDGPGATLVQGGCGICHGLDRVVAANRPGQQWGAIVHRMVEIGAPLSADQSNQIVAYLEANYAGRDVGEKAAK